MAQIITFPAGVSQTHNDKTPAPPKVPNVDELSVFSSRKEDDVFLSLIHQWPCFAVIDKNLNLQEVLDLYYEDELTLAQDCTLEFLFHMNDPKSSFDIGTALYTWTEEDHDFFITSLNLHAEIINQVKQEEM